MRLIINPPFSHQRGNGKLHVSNLWILHFAGPEVRAFTHDQPHPQCLRRSGQLEKISDKLMFFDAQEVVVAGTDPAKDMLKVFQVVESIFERIGYHELNEPPSVGTGYAYRLKPARDAGKSYWMSGAIITGVSEQFSGFALPCWGHERAS